VIPIETSVFTRLVTKTLSDEDYGTLQQWLVDNPDAGDLVGGAGMRKVRWALPGGGKSGAIRVLYYWRVSAEQIYLLFLFAKGERSGSHARTGARAGQIREGAEMKKALFEELVASVKQATEIARGARTPSRTFEVNAATIKQLRSRTKLSQPEFAALLGVELSTLRNWEQGRREPTGPAKALLRAIRNDPQHVIRALSRAA